MRFVQVPTDGSSTGDAFEPGCSTRLWVQVSPGSFDDARRAEFAGVLGALLQRYSQQATVAVDVFDDSGPHVARRLALDLVADGDAPVAALITQADQILREAAARRQDSATASNVAMTFLAATEEPAGSFDVSARVQETCRAYDLAFAVVGTPEGVLVALVYNKTLFGPSMADRLVEGYIALLEATSSDRDTPLGRLTLLGPTEVRALTVEQDSGTASYPPWPVHRSFEKLAATQPGALAVTFQGDSLSYAELEQRANRLAHHLVSRGVGPDVPVAVCLRPSLHVLVAILAIFKARGLYLPLDPTHPRAFLERMVDEANPRMILTQSALSGLSERHRFLHSYLDEDSELLATLPVDPPALEHSLDDPAYLFYTSGTTGKPKGVVATQGNLAHYIRVAQQAYGFAPSDVFCSLARYTFSISLFELLSPLCCGGSLRLFDRDDILAPERLCLALNDVTVVHAGPSLLGSLFRYLRATPTAPRSFPAMRHASSGGDMVQPSIMEEMKQVFENAEIYVIYGCTEISCMGTTFPVRRETKVTRTFVGKPFPDVRLRVLDPGRRLVPFGVVGEICFAGRGIARGYLERPDLTAEKFIEIDGTRFYQTGDMGRLHPDGNLEILGRRDFQIQLRGIRIELAGIEKTVLELGLASQCALVSHALGEDDVRLVAFVVKPTASSVAAFRGALAVELPDYMLPHHVVLLDAMPLTANGKLDRNRLKEMPWDTRFGAKHHTPPHNELEQRLAEVFGHVLGVEDVGVEESFFDLGGDSLRAVVAIQEIEKALGFALAPRVLFEHGTVRSLAQHARDPDAVALRPVLLSDSAAHPPLFMLSGIHMYRPLAQRMGGAYSAYGVFADREVRMFDPMSGHHTVAELARDYVEIIRRMRPEGPYRLLGYSFAGIVAYEVAQQLLAAGQEVRFLALLDAELPEWTLRWSFRLAQLERMRSAPVRDLLAVAWRRLRNGLRRQGWPEFARYQGDAVLAPLEEQRDAINRRAAAEYMPQIRPYGGAVTVITSGERLRRSPLHSPSCGWAPFVPGIHVHRIGADHFRMISEEPYVSQLAEVLGQRMVLREV